MRMLVRARGSGGLGGRAARGTLYHIFSTLMLLTVAHVTGCLYVVFRCLSHLTKNGLQHTKKLYEQEYRKSSVHSAVLFCGR